MKKKTTYELKDGGKITATSPSEFVTEIRESSLFDSDCTNEEYMKSFADRYEQYSSKVIASDTPENFLAALIADGYACIIP